MKQILDVPLGTARRYLRVQAMLAANRIPAGVPEMSVDGGVVMETAGRGYCLLPWAGGSHRLGPELSLEQASRLGTAPNTLTPSRLPGREGGEHGPVDHAPLPRGGDGRARVDARVRYLTDNAEHLRDDQALEAGWPIATGVIEGACRHLITDRFDLAGARWA